jgi:hypothetical protein
MYTGLEGKGMAARGGGNDETMQSFKNAVYRCSLVIFDSFVSSLTCGVGSTSSLLTIMVLCSVLHCQVAVATKCSLRERKRSGSSRRSESVVSPRKQTDRGLGDAT